MFPIIINIFFLKINVIQYGSALNIGQNYLGEWSNTSKVNSGTGSLYGDQSTQDSSDVCLDDADLFDLPVWKETRGGDVHACLPRERYT